MTSRKIVAVFDSREAAQNARTSLIECGLDTGRISISDQESSEFTTQSQKHRGGFWAHVKEMFMPDSDRETLDESLRRGGFVLVASVDETRVDEAIARLEASGAVDLEQRESEWRAAGWKGGVRGATEGAQLEGESTDSTAARAPADLTAARASTDSTATRGPTASTVAGASTASTTARAPADSMAAQASTDSTVAGASTASTATPESAGSLPAGESEAIPVVEEKLRVGKREVNRGGVRVRSYIVEEPVHEEVRLREERVRVERRPVDAPARPVVKGSPDDLMQERTIEVTETAEQAVVGKEARITEEVVITKEADEHVEQIDDTVRRTEVEVDDARTEDARTDQARRKTPPRAPDRPGRH